MLCRQGDKSQLMGAKEERKHKKLWSHLLLHYCHNYHTIPYNCQNVENEIVTNLQLWWSLKYLQQAFFSSAPSWQSLFPSQSLLLSMHFGVPPSPPWESESFRVFKHIPSIHFGVPLRKWEFEATRKSYFLLNSLPYIFISLIWMFWGSQTFSRLLFLLALLW